MTTLPATVILDYQNVHLVTRDVFDASRYRPVHESLIDPLLFAQQLIETRNAKQRAGFDHAELRRVLVFRGLPSAEHEPKAFDRNQAQRAHWERDPRVQVTLRPLRYTTSPGVGGARVVTGKREKGIDVLCALAVLREARREEVRLVILASQDSDLAPAIEQALELDEAKIETASWYHPNARNHQLRVAAGGRRPWNTRLGEVEFNKCLDQTNYL